MAGITALRISYSVAQDKFVVLYTYFGSRIQVQIQNLTACKWSPAALSNHNRVD